MTTDLINKTRLIQHIHAVVDEHVSKAQRLMRKRKFDEAAIHTTVAQTLNDLGKAIIDDTY